MKMAGRGRSHFRIVTSLRWRSERNASNHRRIWRQIGCGSEYCAIYRTTPSVGSAPRTPTARSPRSSMPRDSSTQSSKASAIAPCSFPILATGRTATSIFCCRVTACTGLEMRQHDWAMSRLFRTAASQRPFTDHGSQDRLAMARRFLRSRNANVHRSAFPALELRDGAVGSHGPGLFLGAPAEPGTRRRPIHRASSGRHDRILGAALAAASAARRSAAFPYLRTRCAAPPPRGRRRVLEHVASSYTINRCGGWRRFVSRSPQSWFACRLPEARAKEIERLSPDVKRWLETYSLVAGRQPVPSQ